MWQNWLNSIHKIKAEEPLLMNKLENFRKVEAGILLECMKSHNIYDIEFIDSIIHALVDISESVEKIYGKIIPEIIDNSNLSSKQLKEKLWDIREDFRHIEYHINDAKIADL